jgi:hypothetical protein
MFLDGGSRAYAGATGGRASAGVRGALRLFGDPSLAEEGPPRCVRIAELDAALELVARLDDHAGELDAEWLDEPASDDRHVRPARPAG